MKQNIIPFSIVLLGTFIFQTVAPAHAKRPLNRKVVNTRWEQKADTDNNGLVGGKELKDFSQDHPNWVDHKQKVNTANEELADKNNDGIVDAEELRIFRKNNP